MRVAQKVPQERREAVRAPAVDEHLREQPAARLHRLHRRRRRGERQPDALLAVALAQRRVGEGLPEVELVERRLQPALVDAGLAVEAHLQLGVDALVPLPLVLPPLCVAAHPGVDRRHQPLARQRQLPRLLRRVVEERAHVVDALLPREEPIAEAQPIGGVLGVGVGVGGRRGTCGSSGSRKRRRQRIGRRRRLAPRLRLRLRLRLRRRLRRLLLVLGGGGGLGLGGVLVRGELDHEPLEPLDLPAVAPIDFLHLLDATQRRARARLGALEAPLHLRTRRLDARAARREAPPLCLEPRRLGRQPLRLVGVAAARRCRRRRLVVAPPLLGARPFLGAQPRLQLVARVLRRGEPRAQLGRLLARRRQLAIEATARLLRLLELRARLVLLPLRLVALEPARARLGLGLLQLLGLVLEHRPHLVALCARLRLVPARHSHLLLERLVHRPQRAPVVVGVAGALRGRPRLLARGRAWLLRRALGRRLPWVGRRRAALQVRRRSGRRRRLLKLGRL